MTNPWNIQCIVLGIKLRLFAYAAKLGFLQLMVSQVHLIEAGREEDNKQKVETVNFFVQCDFKKIGLKYVCIVGLLSLDTEGQYWIKENIMINTQCFPFCHWICSLYDMTLLLPIKLAYHWPLTETYTERDKWGIITVEIFKGVVAHTSFNASMHS